DVLIGAGTVITTELAASAIMSGAVFIVGPHYEAEVQHVAERHRVLYVPGALTPSEVHAAARATGGLVKVFPVGRMGASAYVRDLLGPYPDLELMVTGGVTLATAPEYLAAGARVVGIGSLFDMKPAELARALAAV
ncbi:MAG TPA: hypothetical protein VFD39_05025, partial [Trueperaceae bacterium]|nr:hypothetical protein [Trueperaceae bacterium]